MTLGFTTNVRNNLKNDELKRRLFECANVEHGNFLKIAETFYHQERHNDNDYIEFCKTVIATVDRVLAIGNWEDSLFLRNTVKPLKQIREQAHSILEQVTGKAEPPHCELPKFSDDKTLLYISLFQNDGLNLHRWELQLRSIESYLIGRPVYAKEEDVQKEIRMKITQTSEAYVIVGVDKAAIQKEPYQSPRIDRNGNPLVALAVGAVTSEKILEFVHQGKRYRFIDGKLIARN